MKTLIVLCVSVLATACVTTPVTENVIPIDLVQGESIHLWSVSAERTPGGTKVVGFAARRQTPNEPVNEHLHAEAIGADGQIVQFNSVRWNSIVSLRTRKSASFQTVFGPESASLVRVKLSVVAGAIHKDGQ